MLLTSKCRKDFNKWRFEVLRDKRDNVIPIHNKRVVNSLIIEWLDSVGIYVDVQPWADFDDTDTYQKTVFITNVSYIEDKQIEMFEPNSEEMITFPTRTIGLEEGIKIANKIYNER